MNKKKTALVILGIVAIGFIGFYFADGIIKKQNYEKECAPLLTNMDACFANNKCQAISYCPKFTFAKTACCPKGILEMFSIELI